MPSGSRSRRCCLCGSPKLKREAVDKFLRETSAVREVRSVFLRVGQKIRFFCKNSVRRQSEQIFEGQIA